MIHRQGGRKTQAALPVFLCFEMLVRTEERCVSLPPPFPACGIAAPASRWAWSRVKEDDQADGANYRLMPLHLAVTARACTGKMQIRAAAPSKSGT